MKKIALLFTSIGAVFLVGISAVAISGIGQLNKLNTPVKASPTEHSFTFDTVTGSQLDEDKLADEQTVNVETGSSSPISTTFNPLSLGSLAFGQGGKFVEAHPSAEKYCGYFLLIGINNLTHFEIDMGVAKDVGTEDMYTIQLRDKNHSAVKQWTYSPFELDGDGNGTAHLEWDKGITDGTVVEVYAGFSFREDSAETSLYIESLSLVWNC